jgi:hypothetical protein
MPYEYVFDETGQPNETFNAAKALYQFIYDNWQLTSPYSVNDITWLSWPVGINGDYLTIQFWEEITGRQPLGTNWRMGAYVSRVGIYLFSQLDGGGQIPEQLLRAKSHIDMLVSREPEAMRVYGISGFRVLDLGPTRKSAYPTVNHKSSTYEFAIYVQLIYSKSTQLV